MAAAAAAILAGVERLVPAWVVGEVDRILDAWGRLDPEARGAARSSAAEAGEAAAGRVTAELRDLFGEAPADQRATPLQIVRTVVDEPTRLLEQLGVAPVQRDEFEERAHPFDRYGLVPRALGDLGDQELSAQLLVWGVAKSKLVRPPV